MFGRTDAHKIGFSFVIVILMLLSVLGTAGIPRVSASSTALSDNFALDTSLNTNLWQVNGPVGNYVFTHVGSPPASIVQPATGFSQNGLGISGVSCCYEAASIQSIQSFSAPFTLTTTVESTVANGNPFVLALSSQDGSQTGYIAGNINPGNDGYYGIWYGSGSSLLSQRIVSNPSVNVWYTLTIAVNPTGSAIFSVSSGNTLLGSVTNPLGTGPFHVLLGQFEGLPYTTGPNQAYWRSASLSPVTCVLSQPLGIAFDPANNDIYVADFGSNTVSVISGATNTIIATIAVGTNPNQVAYDPFNHEIYVSNSGSTTVSAISSSTNTVVATIPVDPNPPPPGGYGPYWLAFDPANNEMFVTNYNFPSFSNTVSAIESNNVIVHTITVGTNPIRLAYDPANGDMYVDDYSSAQVSVIDSSNTVIATINGLPGNPNTVGYDPANHNMYVSSNNSNSVTVISSALNMVVTTIGVGGNPYGMFYDPANTEMYVSATVGNAVYAIDSTTNTPSAAIPANNSNLPGPYTITYDPATTNMYVSDTNDNSFSPSTVTVISSTNNRVITNVPVGASPDLSVFDPADNDLYVVNRNSDSVSVISPNNIVIATITAASCAPPQSISVSKFFTDTSFNPLPKDQFGNPKVDVVIAGGVVRSTNPGEIMAWVNVTNTDGSLQSLKLNETLPMDWVIAPPWMPALGAIHVFYAKTTSLATNPEITQPSTIIVSGPSPPQTVHVAIPSFNATAIGHPLLQNQSILLEVKLDYALDRTTQSASTYPRNYTDTASATAWSGVSYMGNSTSGNASGFFVAYAKVVGDVDGDGSVDIADLVLVWQHQFSNNPQYDVNGDGAVDLNDLVLTWQYQFT